MKSGGRFLFGVGLVLFISALIWGRTGVYQSQLVPFFGLLAISIITIAIGGKMMKDPNPHKPVDWKPAETKAQLSAPAAPPPPPPPTPQVTANVAQSPSEPRTGEMMECPQCGNPTPFEATQCTKCGVALDTSALIAPPPILSAQPVPPVEQLTDHQNHSNDVISLPPGMVAPAASLSVPPPPPPPTPPVIHAAPTPQPTAVNPPTFIAAPQSAALAEDLDATRASVRRRTGSPWRLVLPEGPNVVVDGAILIGRSPAAHPNWSEALLLPVNDAHNSLSKTHAVIQFDPEGLWVTDLDSTNGVVVVRADGTEVELESNQRFKVDAGWDIELGDFIIQVEKD